MPSSDWLPISDFFVIICLHLLLKVKILSAFTPAYTEQPAYVDTIWLPTKEISLCWTTEADNILQWTEVPLSCRPRAAPLVVAG